MSLIHSSSETFSSTLGNGMRCFDVCWICSNHPKHLQKIGVQVFVTMQVKGETGQDHTTRIRCQSTKEVQATKLTENLEAFLMSKT